MKKVVVITGDSSGIGEVLAKKYSQDCIVYGISRRKIDVDYTHFEADVLDFDRIKEIMSKIYAENGRIDMLICSAGLGVAGAFETMSSDEINRQLQVNLNGVLNLNKAVIPYMREQNGGKIVNISSVAGVAPMPFQALYSASKAAINSFSMALANELKPFHIKVVSVMPGDAKTGFTSSRVKVFDRENLYGGRVENSIQKMENDELSGGSAEFVGQRIYRHINKKNPKVLYTVGFTYKVLVWLMKILPAGFVNKMLYKIYAQ